MTLGVFAHLVPVCKPCEQQVGVGAVDTATLVTSAGGIPTLTPTASQAISLLLAGRYPQQTGSGRIVNGAPINEPAFDPGADYQTLTAAQQGSGASVLDQMKSLPAGAIALFDFNAIVSNLNGTPVDIPYAIAKNAQIAKTLAPSAQLVALSGTAGGTTEEKSSTKPIWGGLIIGGVLLFVTGNPLVAVAGGAAGGLLLSKSA